MLTLICSVRQCSLYGSIPFKCINLNFCHSLAKHAIILDLLQNYYDSSLMLLAELCMPCTSLPLKNSKYWAITITVMPVTM